MREHLGEYIDRPREGFDNGGEEFAFKGALLPPLVVADVECSGPVHYFHERFLEIPRIHRLIHGYRTIWPWNTE
jgi:hypothetical protein